VDLWPWFRFPFGITTQLIINRVPGSLHPGEIVLMHCGPGGMKAGDHSTLDACALPAVIPSVRPCGYSSVTVAGA
jgi:peptidoglycan/xylan/chitin deacetylase (PgdA/CDA1 family)